MVHPEGFGKPRPKKCPLDTFYFVNSARPFRIPIKSGCTTQKASILDTDFSCWCTRRDSASRVLKSVHWTLFAYANTPARPFRIPIKSGCTTQKASILDTDFSCWCTRRDSASRVLKSVHWTLFAYANTPARPFRIPIKSGCTTQKASIFDADFSCWCTRRDSNPRSQSS